MRLATAADVAALAALYRDAASTLGPQVYAPEQVEAWARSTEDRERFARYLLDAQTWIDETSEGTPRGFCGVSIDDRAGEVHSLYVCAALTCQGVGTRLLAHALAEARAQGALRFGAWATPFSRPLFERAGFVLQRVISEPYRGVVFDRFRMTRT